MMLALLGQLFIVLVRASHNKVRPDRTWSWKTLFFENWLPVIRTLSAVATLVVLWYYGGPGVMSAFGLSAKPINAEGAILLGMGFQAIAQAIQKSQVKP